MYHPFPHEDLSRLFDPRAISPETHAVNHRLMQTLAALPPLDDLKDMRDAYADGRMGLPVSPQSARAWPLAIPGPAGPLSLRVIAPDTVRGVYLHIHGGGWMLGTTDMQDALLEPLARTAGLACVSVAYRRAPEHPYPAPVDDCVAAARWLIANSAALFGTSLLTIGGESAGAHLAASALIRLRDAGEAGAFRAANLTFGCFDLSLTPSMRRAEGTAFIDRTVIDRMIAAYCGDADRRDPGISPLFADLSGLPPALFTVGTIDPLVDDSLFMHARWQAAGNVSQLAVYPGGVHGFHLFDSAIAASANDTIASFMAANSVSAGTII